MLARLWQIPVWAGSVLLWLGTGKWWAGVVGLALNLVGFVEGCERPIMFDRERRR